MIIVMIYNKYLKTMGNAIKHKNNSCANQRAHEVVARIRFNERELAYNRSQHGSYSVYIKGCREQFLNECRYPSTIVGYNFISQSVNREKDV